ncbi:MAG: BlaI/MecI/CopY family transcriptional regulator [Thermoplasmata archaeon]|nr:BlaI/MecI/CopY family transcriptional regulator [Thermoplasmata archaeon]
MAENLKEEIRYLTKRIEELEKLVASLLNPYKMSAEAIAQTNTLAANYLTLLKLYLQHGKVTPEILLPDLKDPIAGEIVAVLFEKREANISEIADELRKRRGKGSRATVRTKIKKLEEIGAVEKVEGRGSRYRVSTELVNKWLKLLGLVK